MKRVIRLTESELNRIIKKVISEAEPTRRTSNLADPETFLRPPEPKAVVSKPRSTYNINYPDIPEPKAAPTQPIAPKTIFGIGDRGPEVLAFQKHLVALGYNVGKNGPDGIFGPNTEAAVKDFQSKNGIKVSGRVGPPTKGKLASAVNRNPNSEWNQDRAYDELPTSPMVGNPPKSKEKTDTTKFSAGGYASPGFEGTIKKVKQPLKPEEIKTSPKFSAGSYGSPGFEGTVKKVKQKI